LHKELTDHGFEVVSAVSGDNLLDPSGHRSIDAALADAIASVHLIGRVPDPTSKMADDLVSLQLAKAADKVANKATTHHRSRTSGASSGHRKSSRIPSATRPRRSKLFAPRLPATVSKSDTISRFIESLLPYLDGLVSGRPASSRQSPDGKSISAMTARREGELFI